MTCRIFRVVLQNGGLRIDLILQTQLPILVQQPNGSSCSSQRSNYAGEQFWIELFRSSATFGQLGNFVHQPSDLGLGVLNGLLIDRHGYLAIVRKGKKDGTKRDTNEFAGFPPR